MLVYPLFFLIQAFLYLLLSKFLFIALERRYAFNNRPCKLGLFDRMVPNKNGCKLKAISMHKKVCALFCWLQIFVAKRLENFVDLQAFISVCYILARLAVCYFQLFQSTKFLSSRSTSITTLGQFCHSMV